MEDNNDKYKVEVTNEDKWQGQHNKLTRLEPK